MKKLLSIMLVLIFGVGIGSAHAFSLSGGYLGPVKFKFSNFEEMRDPSGGASYYVNDGNGIEDNWGVFQVTEIRADDGTNTLLWNGVGVGGTNEELTGVFYDIDIQCMVVDSIGQLKVQSVGGRLDVYLDPTPDFDASLGTGGYYNLLTPGIAHDEYTTATDGSLFLSTVFIPGIDPNNDSTVDGTFDAGTIPSSGDAHSYLSITGGAYQWMFDTDGYSRTYLDDPEVAGTPPPYPPLGTVSTTILADLHEVHDFISNDGSVTPVIADWDLLSEDPVRGTAVPEPATMLLLGSGLIGLAGFVRKKKFFKKV